MSNNDYKQSTHRGIGLASLLTVAFIVLKLCGIIGWAWGWVLAPLWIKAGLWVLGIICSVVAELNKE